MDKNWGTNQSDKSKFHQKVGITGFLLEKILKGVGVGQKIIGQCFTWYREGSMVLLADIFKVFTVFLHFSSL